MKILLIGTNGRMGHEVQKYFKTNGVDFCWIDKHNREDVQSDIDVILDFSSHEALEENLILAKRLNVPIVIATTNHNKNNLKLIKNHSKNLPVFMSANFSILFNIMKKICGNIYGEFDYVLTETHHKNKKDKPSGSAKALLKILSKNKIKPKVICNRISNVIGEHKLQIYGNSEVLEISHTVYSREVFCSGAYIACKYILNKKSGMYGMEDLICDCL